MRGAAHDHGDAQRRAPRACRPRDRRDGGALAGAPEGVAAWRWRSTARSCRAASGRPPGCATARSSRCCTRCREARERVRDRRPQLESRLILGTGGFRNLEVMAEAARESGAELATVAMRRVDPSARGSIVEVLEEAGLEVLPNTAGCFTAREAVTTARLAREALGDRLGEARGDRRRPHAAARPRRAARRRRGAGGRRLHGAALHERRPDPGAAARGRGLRRGDAARLADRERHGDQQPLQPAPDRRAGARAGDPRRGRRHRLRRRAGDGGRLRRRAARKRDLPRRGPARDGARDAQGGRGRLRGARGGAHPAAPLRAGVLARGGRRRAPSAP